MRSAHAHIIALASFLLLATAVSVEGAEVPTVTMVIDNYDYMISLFPDDYPNRRQALKACASIATEAGALKAFWDENGPEILSSLSYYAGIDWVESDFDIYIVKYFPDYACQRPMTIPLEGKKNGSQIISVPQGLSHYITLFQQLSKRLLEQVMLPGAPRSSLAAYPMMQKTARRFDNLANLLALRTLEDFWNIDSVLAVFRSEHWRQREIGQDVLFGYLWDRWRLSGDSTLAFWLTSESNTSALVELTRMPVRAQSSLGRGTSGLQSPSGGRLGISVARDPSGFFRVLNVDTLKLGYISGLRKNDVIRSIEGAVPGNMKELFSLLLAYLEQGAEVKILRDGRPEAVIIYSWDSVTEP